MQFKVNRLNYEGRLLFAGEPVTAYRYGNMVIIVSGPDQTEENCKVVSFSTKKGYVIDCELTDSIAAYLGVNMSGKYERYLGPAHNDPERSRTLYYVQQAVSVAS